jgi:hypothetical protein
MTKVTCDVCHEEKGPLTTVERNGEQLEVCVPCLLLTPRGLETLSSRLMESKVDLTRPNVCNFCGEKKGKAEIIHICFDCFGRLRKEWTEATASK